MPELPEVETIVRTLSALLIGQEVQAYKLFPPSVLKRNKEYSLGWLKGKKIKSICRRGKFILFLFQGERILLFHLKMTGKLLLIPSSTPVDKHTRFILSFIKNEKELRFHDVRKFGYLEVLKTYKIEQELKNLGPDPLQIDVQSFSQLLSERKAGIKSLLLNQSLLAGIGNIYADEILFEAKIHPLSKASSLSLSDQKRLWKAIHKVLREAIHKKGSSIRNYTDAQGAPGTFQNYHRVYKRESLPCFRCGTFIQRIRAGGRSSYFCPRCQKL